jgi:arylamine N-acetyltransferase
LTLRPTSGGSGCAAGRTWLVQPIPFGPGGPYEQSGWRFRIIEDNTKLVLQTDEEGQWSDVYAFVPEPVPPIDLEGGNWFTSSGAHPDVVLAQTPG